MEVPRLQVGSELQLPAYTTATAMPDLTHVQPTLWLTAMLDILSHLARPGIEPAFSWILVGFTVAESQWELLDSLLTQIIAQIRSSCG